MTNQYFCDIYSFGKIFKTMVKFINFDKQFMNFVISVKQNFPFAIFRITSCAHFFLYNQYYPSHNNSTQ
jgi:hypothetical protein